MLRLQRHVPSSFAGAYHTTNSKSCLALDYQSRNATKRLANTTGRLLTVRLLLDSCGHTAGILTEGQQASHQVAQKEALKSLSVQWCTSNQHQLVGTARTF